MFSDHQEILRVSHSRMPLYKIAFPLKVLRNHYVIRIKLGKTLINNSILWEMGRFECFIKTGEKIKRKGGGQVHVYF